MVLTGIACLARKICWSLPRGLECGPFQPASCGTILLRIRNAFASQVSLHFGLPALLRSEDNLADCGREAPFSMHSTIDPGFRRIDNVE